MAKSLQRRKPGYNKDGTVRIVSLSGKQLTELLSNTSKKKVRAKIQRRIQDLGYVAPAVEEKPAE
jgi:hypothetical protein